MKKHLLFAALLLIIFTASIPWTSQVNCAKDSQSIETSDWYSEAVQTIKAEEYHISYSAEANEYQSPNSAQNLRFIYSAAGFTAKPRTTKMPLPDQNDRTLRAEKRTYRQIEDWQVSMNVDGYGKIIKTGASNGTTILNRFTGKEFSVDQNMAFIQDDGLKIGYENSAAGMRQNFIVKEKPKGNGFLKVNISTASVLTMRVSADMVAFANDAGEDKLKYDSLKVWDAQNKRLAAHFEKETENHFSIVVNDENAVYPVTIDPLSRAANWSAESDQASSEFGYSVSTAGDVNGDGYGDVIVGAYYYDNGQSDEGRAFVYHGSASGLSASANWSAEINQEGAWFGWSVSSAGDVNGDGYSDIIVGAVYCSHGQSKEGAAFVYHGSASGLSASANWMGESNQEKSRYGISVSAAGDVNGDGYSDVIVGARYYDNGQDNEGRAFVYYGSASGLDTIACWSAESDQTGSEFGYCVSTAGDVNDDGYGDVIVGARYYDYGQSNEGRAFVYHGSASGLSASADWTAESNQLEANFGKSVSSAGDVNGDGYDDVIVGCFAYDNGQTDEGRAYVYHGSASGLSSSANWTAESDQDSAYFGVCVSTAGDVNGDGYSDVIVGANYYTNSEANEGIAYVYHGSANGLDTIANWTVESNQANTEFGKSVSTAGDVNGDSYSDVIVGAHFFDNGQTDEGRAFAYYGSTSGVSAIEAITGINPPALFALEQNYPNPFNPSTSIGFSIAEPTLVKLAVYNLLGQEVQLLKNEYMKAGFFTVTFNAASLPSGMYLYKLETAKNSCMKKMMLIR